MGASRDDPRVRAGTRLVAALAVTPDAGIERFRARRAADPRITTDDLERAREVLDAVGFALAGTNAENWRRLRQAWEVLRRNTPPEVVAPPPDVAAATSGPASGASTSSPSASSVSASSGFAASGLAPAGPVPAGMAAAPRAASPTSPRFEKTPAPATTPGRRPDEGAASPWAAGGGYAPSAPAPRPKAQPRAESAAAPQDDVDSTLGFDVRLAQQAPLPFEGASEPAAPASAALDEHPDVGATAFALPALSDDEALPFESSERTAEPPLPSAAAPQDDVDSTLGFDVRLLDLAPTPFEEAAVRALPPSLEIEEHPDAGATSFALPALTDDEALPFEPSAAAHAELTSSQYASYCVDRETSLDPQAIDRRYGIPDERAARALHDHWRRRFASSPGLHTTFQQQVRDYRAWLATQGRRRP